jgi:ADP-heptose:LPS heptosyltransferase
MPENLILRTTLPPGDVCTLTAAIESLHVAWPGRYRTDVRTMWNELFLHNPRLTPLRDEEGRNLDMGYTDAINRADDLPLSFLDGYRLDLQKQLGVAVPPCTNRPHLYLSPAERSAAPQWGEYWIVCAGVKSDFTLKQWPVEYYQRVIDHFAGAIQFVQVGSSEHDHPTLQGVRSLVGKTTLRDLVCLVYHAKGGLGPITLIQHLFAAFLKPYIALLGGREPVAWTQYPLQTTLHTMGQLPCCRLGACWRSRVLPLGDAAEQDRSWCQYPILDFQRPVGRCMAMIQPEEVIRVMERFAE